MSLHKHNYEPTNKRRSVSDEKARLFRGFDIYECNCGQKIFWETTTFPKWKYNPIYNPNPTNEPENFKLYGLEPIDWDKFNKGKQ